MFEVLASETAQSGRQEASKITEVAPSLPCQGLRLFVSQACPTTIEATGQSGQGASHGLTGRPMSVASVMGETKVESRGVDTPSETTTVVSLVETTAASSSSKRATGRQIVVAICRTAMGSHDRPSPLGPKGRQAIASRGQRRPMASATIAGGHGVARPKTTEATVSPQTSREMKAAPFASMHAVRTLARVVVMADADAGRQSRTAIPVVEVSAKAMALIPVAAGRGKTSVHDGLVYVPTRSNA